MNNLSATSSSSSSIATTRSEWADRQKLMGELHIMSELFEYYSGLNDEMSQEIKEWHADLLKALKLSDEKAILDEFIPTLQEILKDPFLGAPLDLHAVLGNDGFTYSHIALEINRELNPDMPQNCSPMFPNSPKPFVHTPHPIARHMLGWLQKHDALLYSPALKNIYLHQLGLQMTLMAANPAEETEDERIARTIAEMEWRDRIEEEQWEQQSRAVEQQLQQARAEITQNFIRLSKALDKVPEHLQGVRAEIALVQENERREIAALHEAIRPFAQQIKAFTQESKARMEEVQSRNYVLMSKVDAMCDDLQKEIDGLSHNTEELNAKLDDISAENDEVQKREYELQKMIIETQKKLRKKKIERRKKIIRLAAVITGCVVGSVCLYYALQGTGLGGLIVPSGDGAQLSLKLQL